jgi:hypothetical protein
MVLILIPSCNNTGMIAEYLLAFKSCMAVKIEKVS